MTTSVTATRTAMAQCAEALTASELESVCYAVTNLNTLVGNCPFADLIARRDGTRLLVQVKSTTTEEGKFGAPPHRARALEIIGTELDSRTIYAFVHLPLSQPPQVRFATATEVGDLAEADEARYAGTNRYHVNITQFSVDAARINDLL